MSDKRYADSLGLPTHEPSVTCGAWCLGGIVSMDPTKGPEYTDLAECWVRGDTVAAEVDELKQGYESQFKEIGELKAELAALRARVAELEADAQAGRKLWSYMVENNLPWSDYDLQDALTAIGLLVAKDMDGEDEAEQCLNCDGDCHTCYRVSETLLVERATESAGGGHVHD